MLSIKDLEACFQKAKSGGFKYVGVKFQIFDYPKNEIIINCIENVDLKLEYYKRCFNNELKVYTSDGIIQIVGFTFGNSFADIESDLI